MRLIDGDTLWEKLDDEPWYDNADRDEIALPIVAAAPTVDAVAVTRCKDCEGGQVSDNGEYIICCRLGLRMDFQDFCSQGEKKTEAMAVDNLRNELMHYTNDLPDGADYCPVPDIEGVCRYEDRRNE